MENTGSRAPRDDSSPRDVVVVGASAAGLLAASRVAEAGQKTTVLERCPTLDPAVRTLIVTSRMRDQLGDAATASVVNEISRFELYANGQVAEVKLDKPDLVVERSKLIRRLADDAREAGASIETGRRVGNIVGGSTGATIEATTGTGESETYRSRYVIGADGARSKVARCAGVTAQTTAPLLQAVVDLPPDMNEDTTRVWFRPWETRYFYWLIPEGNGRAALGLIGEDARSLRSRLEDFMKEKSLTPHSFQAAHIPIYRRWTPMPARLGDASVYLVGDAAGHVKVSTVGGLVTGFKGAEAVASAIVTGSDKPLKALKRELDLHKYIRSALHRFEQDDYAFILKGINQRAATAMGSYDRDDAARVLWNVFKSRPQLILHGLRSLLTRPG